MEVGRTGAPLERDLKRLREPLLWAMVHHRWVAAEDAGHAGVVIAAAAAAVVAHWEIDCRIAGYGDQLEPPPIAVVVGLVGVLDSVVVAGGLARLAGRGAAVVDFVVVVVVVAAAAAAVAAAVGAGEQPQLNAGHAVQLNLDADGHWAHQ